MKWKWLLLHLFNETLQQFAFLNDKLLSYIGHTDSLDSDLSGTEQQKNSPM